jgi:glycosyltransferase involved in cell wall biosynthesis
MDEKSSTLGFMIAWISKMASKYDSVTVICLYKGVCFLPDNVKVISLGKEKSGQTLESGLQIKNTVILKLTKFLAKCKYIALFYKNIFLERANYDKVFVHMNREYVLLGGMFWKLLGKPVSLWSNHYAGNILTDMTRYFCKNIFYTSLFSYTANQKKFPNAIQMPVGVDLDSLKTSLEFEQPPNSILFLARLAPAKRPELLLRALHKLKEDGYEFTCDFVGGASADLWPNYERDVIKLKEDLGLGENVRFVGSVPSTETYKHYLSHTIYVNVAKSGMLDKTLFKALAAGLLTLTTSIDYNKMIEKVVGDEFRVEEGSVDSLVEKLKHALSLDKEHRLHKVKLMQDEVIEKHSLDNLIQKIYELV